VCTQNLGKEEISKGEYGDGGYSEENVREGYKEEQTIWSSNVQAVF